MTIKTTIGQLLLKNNIYVVKKQINDSYQIIYVGKANKQGVAERIHNHIVNSKQSPDKIVGDFGRILHNTCPNEYDMWDIEIFSLKECENFLDTQLESLKEAEIKMIEKLNPLSNQKRKD